MSVGNLFIDSLPVTLTDGTGVAQDVNVKQIGGATTATGAGTATGALRVELPTNGTGVVGLNAGTALIGKVAIDQTTEGTTNGVVLHGSRMVEVAFATLTRPANATPYTGNDSISDNTAAGSVTALVATVSDTNDAPIILTELRLDTNDTGLAAAIAVRAYLYNADPTASSGVVGGDNAAFSNKKNGFIGSMSGTFRAFSDGGRARLVPEEGSYIIALPATGAKTLWIQYQTLAAFTPSANSTTIDARLKGFQARA